MRRGLAKAGEGAVQNAVKAAVAALRLLLTVRWGSLAKVLCRVLRKAQAAVQNSGKGAVQGAVQAGVGAARLLLTVQQMSGKGAVQGVLCRVL